MPVEIRGLEQLVRNLQGLALSVDELARDALREEAEIEMTEARARTPVDTGALRASGVVRPPETAVDGVAEVKLVFGGPAAPYAVYVHEDMEAFHKVGQAKFLESTVLESAPYMAQRVAAAVRRRLRA